MDKELSQNKEENNEQKKPLFNASSGTGIMGSIIFMSIMLIIMIIVAKFMH